MPLYDFLCSKCGKAHPDVFRSINTRDNPEPCSCGGIAQRQVSCTSKGGVHMFRAGFYEHIAEEPIYCGTKADLRAACRNHNSGSDYAW